MVPPPPTPAAAARLQAPQASVNVADAVSAASDRYRLDPDLLNSVIRAESGFNPRAVSPKGAQGLMQLMPDTASKLGVRRVRSAGERRWRHALLARAFRADTTSISSRPWLLTMPAQKGGTVPRGPSLRETHAYVASIVRDFNRKKLPNRKLPRRPKPIRCPCTNHRRQPKPRKRVQHLPARPLQNAALFPAINFRFRPLTPLSSHR